MDNNNEQFDESEFPDFTHIGFEEGLKKLTSKIVNDKNSKQDMFGLMHNMLKNENNADIVTLIVYVISYTENLRREIESLRKSVLKELIKRNKGEEKQ